MSTKGFAQSMSSAALIFTRARFNSSVHVIKRKVKSAKSKRRMILPAVSQTYSSRDHHILNIGITYSTHFFVTIRI